MPDPVIKFFRQRLSRIALFACIGAGAVPAFADPVITEFMASNKSTLADEDGEFSDWIEIYNPDASAVNLSGWYLTDNAKKKNKWTFPGVILAPQSFLIVFASGKDRSNPAQTLHTNFSLDASGEYLGLIRPDGSTATSEFSPTYPAQFGDISFGVTQPTDGSTPQTDYLRVATPGSANTTTTILPGAVTFSRAAGPFTGSFTLELSGATTGQKIRYVVAAPSATAVPEPTAAATEYTGPITISSSVIVRAELFSTDDKQHGLPATAQFVKLSDATANFSSKLPIVVLDSHGSGALSKDGSDRPAWLYLYDTAPNGTATLATQPSLATPTLMSVRGNFSSNFPKQSFNVTLQDDRGHDDSKTLLDLDHSSEWALVAPYTTDRSYIRNAFVYALSNRLGHWAPRTRFVETFVNTNIDGITTTDYAGISILTDKIKIESDRVDIKSLAPSDTTAPAITGGYVFKFDPVPDPDHYNFVTNRGIPEQTNDTTALIIDIPKASKLTLPQRDYIRNYIQKMEDSLFDAKDSGYLNRTYLDYVDLPSWVDHHLLEVLVGNVDALFHSEYFYKDRGGKIVSGPVWDFDGTMDDGDARNVNWDTWDTTGGRDVWNYGWWGPLAHDPEFMQRWIDRWQTLRQNELSAANLAALADFFADQIGPDAAARDLARWPECASRYGGSYLTEVAHLKDWITKRGIWIDQQFLAAPSSVEAAGSLTFTPPSGAQLAYTLDGSDPRSLGGEIAPNAIISSAPVKVAANANVHVRSYRADLKDRFPGSPWSSAAQGSGSSPLSPRATLINLSSRAAVGANEATLIAGVTVIDTVSKNYLARGIGPTLGDFGVAGTLADPVLSIFRSDGAVLYRNSGWQKATGAAQLPALFESVGAFPLKDGGADSALAASLPAGGYTFQVTSADNQTGVALVELYTLDGNGRTFNLSTRARVRADSALAGGFVVQGPAYKRMLIRAIGPTLSSFGLTGVLADPIFNLYSGQTIVASNDDWSVSANDPAVVSAAAKVVGAFALPANSKDAALLITLAPGNYTIEVRGKNDTEGVALLEIYEVP